MPPAYAVSIYLELWCLSGVEASLCGKRRVGVELQDVKLTSKLET